jgi:hypothetical protein
MKYFISFLLLCTSVFQVAAQNNAEYTLIIDGMDWGPAASKVVLSLDAPIKSVDMTEYSILVERSHNCADVPPAPLFLKRMVRRWLKVIS